MKFIEFEKILLEKLNQNPFIKITEFKKISEDIIKEKNYDFKIFESTYSTLYNKLKESLNMNNELIIDKYKLTKSGEIFYRKSIIFNNYKKKKVLLLIKFIYLLQKVIF